MPLPGLSIAYSGTLSSRREQISMPDEFPDLFAHKDREEQRHTGGPEKLVEDALVYDRYLPCGFA